MLVSNSSANQEPCEPASEFWQMVNEMRKVTMMRPKTPLLSMRNIGTPKISIADVPMM